MRTSEIKRERAVVHRFKFDDIDESRVLFSFETRIRPRILSRSRSESICSDAAENPVNDNNN